MVKTVSTMPKLTESAVDFVLPNFTPVNLLKGKIKSGGDISLADFANQPVLIMFICNHCPYVVHIVRALADFANEYQAKGLGAIAINSNDAESYPRDSPAQMREFATHYSFQFPYCYDQSQAVAKAYKAACTPDFFLYDAKHQLVYRGQFDATRPGNDHSVDGYDLRSCVDQLLSGLPINANQIASMGCNIKWRAGNEPDYFTDL